MEPNSIVLTQIQKQTKISALFAKYGLSSFIAFRRFTQIIIFCVYLTNKEGSTVLCSVVKYK